MPRHLWKHLIIVASLLTAGILAADEPQRAEHETVVRPRRTPHGIDERRTVGPPCGRRVNEVADRGVPLE